MKVSELMEFDASKYLKDDEMIRAYLAQAFEAGDPVEIQAALGDVAKARGMSVLARDSGIKREALYRALSDRGNAEFATIMKVVTAMGLHLTLAVPEPAPKVKTKAAPKTTTVTKKKQPAAKRARVQSGTVRARAGAAHA